MIPAPWIRARARGARIYPQLVGPEQAEPLEWAAALLDLFQSGVGQEREHLEEAAQELLEEGGDPKLLRGLAHVLAQLCTFDESPAVDALALREEVFRAARAAGPLALEAGPLQRPTAEQVLAQVGQGRGWTAAQVAAGLYADRKGAQRLRGAPALSPEGLLERYNVALVQSLLLRARWVQLRVSEPPLPRLRQLLRWARFHQLVLEARRDDEAVHLRFDGPASVLQQSTRYGMALAAFFPWVLHLQGLDWRLEAEIEWGPQKLPRQVVIDPALGLVAHRADRGGWQPREVAFFAERFPEAGTGWELVEGERPLVLAGNEWIWPDFTLRKEGRVAHLEVLGFWSPELIARRRAAWKEGRASNLIVALSRKLAAQQKKVEDPEGFLVFADILQPKKVAQEAERVAVPA